MVGLETFLLLMGIQICNGVLYSTFKDLHRKNQATGTQATEKTRQKKGTRHSGFLLQKSKAKRVNTKPGVRILHMHAAREAMHRTGTCPLSGRLCPNRIWDYLVHERAT